MLYAVGSGKKTAKNLTKVGHMDLSVHAQTSYVRSIPGHGDIKVCWEIQLTTTRKMAENGFYPEPELECKFYAVY